MAGVKAKGGKKNRKHGRNARRDPAMDRYRAEARWGRNKARRIEREAARQSACKAVRSLAENAGEPRPHDISRRVRKLRRAA